MEYSLRSTNIQRSTSFEIGKTEKINSFLLAIVKQQKIKDNIFKNYKSILMIIVFFFQPRIKKVMVDTFMIVCK